MVWVYLSRSESFNELYKLPDDQVKLGPFPFVQLTYETFRCGEDEVVGYLNNKCEWVVNGEIYSDVIIHSV